MAGSVAERLGLSAEEVHHVRAAALLHDIGKVAIPDHILNKPGKLDDEEWKLMRQHPEIGERILRAIPGLGSIARIVRHEHESFDGSGYPDALVGDQIPIGSRIILACDAYHAMITDRPYRKGMSHREAVDELARCAGKQFDPDVTGILIGYLHGLRQTGQAEHLVTAEPTHEAPERLLAHAHVGHVEPDDRRARQHRVARAARLDAPVRREAQPARADVVPRQVGALREPADHLGGVVVAAQQPVLAEGEDLLRAVGGHVRREARVQAAQPLAAERHRLDLRELEAGPREQERRGEVIPPRVAREVAEVQVVPAHDPARPAERRARVAPLGEQLARRRSRCGPRRR